MDDLSVIKASAFIGNSLSSIDVGSDAEAHTDSIITMTHPSKLTLLDKAKLDVVVEVTVAGGTPVGDYIVQSEGLVISAKNGSDKAVRIIEKQRRFIFKRTATGWKVND